MKRLTGIRGRLGPIVVLAFGLAACGGPAATAQPTTGSASCAPVELLGPDSRQIDLSGVWSGNDGGRYFVKQLDSCVWWSGLSAFPGQALGDEWIMTFRGTLDGSGVMVGDFVDVKGTNPGAGTMTIRVQSEVRDGQVVVELYREAVTGHQIGVTFWQRAASEPVPTPGGSPPASPSGSPVGSPAPSGSDGPAPTGESPPVTLPPG